MGTLLGDGSIGIFKNYVNARVSFRHSELQEEFFNWKRDILRREISVDKKAHENNKDTHFQISNNEKEHGKRK